MRLLGKTEVTLSLDDSIRNANSENCTCPTRGERDYIFHELTRSTCPVCLKMIDAKVVIRKDGKVIMLKRCPEHGEFEVLVASDADYYCNTLTYNKPGSIPLEFSTEISDGCPNDCGLCPDHEQHTCLGLMEVTSRCNMKCPICYADSGLGEDISLEQARVMLDRYIAAEGRPEVLQISGGEPTLHPKLHGILQIAQESGLKAFLINTNGIRIAQDEDFAASLKEFGDRLEIYLQFDGLSEATGLELRGRNMQDVRERALDNLEKHGIYVNLVTTLIRGVNEHEIGVAIDEAVRRPNIVGVVLQLVSGVGRAMQVKNEPMERLTVPDVLEFIEEQTKGSFRQDDFVPLPCSHPNCCSLTYALVTGKSKKKVKPLTRFVDVHKYLDHCKNTICVNAKDMLDESINQSLNRLWSASASLRLDDVLQDFSRCCGVKVKANTAADAIKQVPGKGLRVIIKPFMDSYNYDLKRAKKCCIHILTVDGRMVPFCNYNIFYRGNNA